MPEIGSADDKELIFFAILFVINIIRDVIEKYVLCPTDLPDPAIQQFRRPASVTAAEDNIFGTVDMLQKRNGPLFYVPPCN